VSKTFKLVVVALLACACAMAQQITGSIRGTVTDPTGAIVQNAIVNARQVETGFVRATTTDGGGAFLFLELPVGHYQLQVSATGFQKYLQDGITLNVNESANVPVRLAVGTAGEQVQVQAEASDR